MLLRHLLKHQFQPEPRGTSWLLTINHQRTVIERLLEQSPSLARLLDDEALSTIYRKAVRDAIIETDLERRLFPTNCPCAIARILDGDWLPDG